MELTEAQIDEITKYWREGVSVQAICEMVGIASPRRFDHLRSGVLSHLENRVQGTGGGRIKVADPTPAEIEARAAVVRSRWTPEERVTRVTLSAVFHGQVSLQEERAATLPDFTVRR